MHRKSSRSPCPSIRNSPFSTRRYGKTMPWTESPGKNKEKIVVVNPFFLRVAQATDLLLKFSVSRAGPQGFLNELQMQAVEWPTLRQKAEWKQSKTWKKTCWVLHVGFWKQRAWKVSQQNPCRSCDQLHSANTCKVQRMYTDKVFLIQDAWECKWGSSSRCPSNVARRPAGVRPLGGSDSAYAIQAMGTYVKGGWKNCWGYAMTAQSSFRTPFPSKLRRPPRDQAFAKTHPLDMNNPWGEGRSNKPIAAVY